MIKHQRHVRILSLLRREGSVDLDAVTRAMPEVSRVTLRRDIAELAEAGALKRTHGGAVLPDADAVGPSGVSHLVPPPLPAGLDDVDAVILPPLSGRSGDALRRHIVRKGVPFLAESAPQKGGTYLGPDNAAAGHAIGVLAGQEAAGEHISVLIVGHPELSNTRARSAGFDHGLREVFAGEVTCVTVNGRGSYRDSLRVARDALRANRDITIVFAVNDHAAQAAIEAGAREARSLRVYAVGGESPDFVGALSQNSALRAVVAFFPEAVGVAAVDRIAQCLSGGGEVDATYTPHAAITQKNLHEYYEETSGRWVLKRDRLDELCGGDAQASINLSGRTIAFMPHYPAHDWYRIMTQAMRDRTERYGMTLRVVPPHHGIAAETTRIRQQIARFAAGRVRAGQTIIVGHGEVASHLAVELCRIAFERRGDLDGLTVITNALDVLMRLSDAPGIRTIMTSGEWQAESRCLVGPSLGALFERVRADTAFLTVEGATHDFGISSTNERLALVGSRFVKAARRRVALADHLAIGVDATHRIARPDEVDEVITDDGAPAADRQRLRAAGPDVLVAGEDDDAPASGEPEAAHANSVGRQR